MDREIVHSSVPSPVLKQESQVSSALRHLDVDDFYVLKLLAEGYRLTDVAKSLSLSQPAITQRMYKIEHSLHTQILERTSRTTRLTEQGLKVCKKFAKAISDLEAQLQ